jgi:hypothetical protein
VHSGQRRREDHREKLRILIAGGRVCERATGRVNRMHIATGFEQKAQDSLVLVARRNV